ncbi:RNA exonuclease 4 [Micractinium conductrix]|uniref:RNA exonuclease 4 n=1 Tax=Micractinium conductrix TaxID=554055 RepID=A0A2P6VRK6_9CHLO|nr:RNA exonuclease 4 [Micractinium conductrix]|eukprot:PSC76736.1 RNA exonuclease 4 [Micractinium conductrix]
MLHAPPPPEGDTAQRRWRHVGGAPPAVWRHARPLAEVRATLSTLLAGRVLVGHHLRKDLAALGLHHPQEATRDTLRFSELQGRRGGGRRLRDLSAERLGRAIQPLGRRHSAREDAQAALDLYLQAVHFQQGRMGFEDLVERELANILAAASSCSGSSDGNQRECS